MKKITGILLTMAMLILISTTAFADVKVHLKKPTAWGAASIYYWNASPAVAAVTWPGKAMTAETNGWYVYTITGANSTSLIFSNNGSSQTANLTRNKEGWYSNGVWYDTNPDVVTPFKVHFKKPTAWATASIYYWNTVPVLTYPAWPGTAMTAEGNNWYVFTINANSSSIIFSNNGATQTADLSRNKEGWYMGSTWYDTNPEDTTAPTASLTAPAAGTVSNTVTVSANASDNIGVAKVAFYYGTTLIAEDTTSPYSVSWNTTTVSNATYAIKAVAYDAAGLTGTSATVAVTVNNVSDTTPPTATITAPAAGTVSNTVTVSANAADNKGVTKVGFYYGTTLIAEDTTSPYSVSWNTSSLANGGYVLKAIAYDAAGLTGTSPTVAVTVSNQGDISAPIATLTAPSAGNVSGIVTVSANAVDNVGVTKVIFYYNSTVIAEDTTAPYSVNWNTTAITKSTYALKAVAYDAIGLTGTSPTVSVTVTTPDTGIGSAHPASGAYSPVAESTWASATFPLGAVTDGTNSTFAVYSKNATKMLLEIYDTKTGTAARYDYWLAKGSDNIWRAKVAGVPANSFYAFRAWGPNWPFTTTWTRGNSSAGFISDVDGSGNRFNPNKVLFDPYTKEISHDKETPELVAAGENGAMFGTGAIGDKTTHGYKGPITNNINIDRRNVDTGKWAPKSILVSDATSFGIKPAIAQKDSIIYEAHPRGLTQHNSAANLSTILAGIGGFENVVSVPDAYRGTYKGAAYMAKYLKALGYTTIEMLPVQETANDINGDSKPGGNFWGYMTYGYFAPDRRYAYDKTPGGPTKEFKEMVKAFHDAGLEIYLDVVYNHTGEGGTWDPSYIESSPGNWTPNPNFTTNCAEITSFRGFDNQEWYALASDKGIFWETTGCGNNINGANTMARKFVLDSLTYWLDQMGVDGFRFDLAPVLGRDSAPNYSFNSNAQLLRDIASLGAVKNAEMIAEAWDCQWPGGYQVSNFPSGWGEWNGFYRDSVRKFIKGGGNKTSGYPSFGDVMNGSYGPLDRSSGNIHTGFADNGGPHKSVNFIVAHDGFTLMDLVSYSGKNNSIAWPFGPSDGGSSDNDSWDCGGNQALRRQQLRNLWTIQMFSRGVPMSVYGDEFARTQNGNNNPYNIDSIATWNNYNMINTDSPHLVSTGSTAPYNNTFGTDGYADSKNNLFLFTKFIISQRTKHPALRQDSYSVPYTFTKCDDSSYITSDDRAIKVSIGGSTVGDSNFQVFINTWTAKLDFKISPASSGKKWVRIIDTAAWAESSNNNIWATNPVALTGVYGVAPWSVVVFEEVNQ